MAVSKMLEQISGVPPHHNKEKGLSVYVRKQLVEANNMLFSIL